MEEDSERLDFVICGSNAETRSTVSCAVGHVPTARTSPLAPSKEALLHHASSVLLILFDIGWVLELPLLGLPCMLLGIASLVYSSGKITHGDCHQRVFSTAMLIWFVSNGLWMSSECLWDGSQPYGILDVFKPLRNLNRSAYPPVMLFALSVLLLAPLLLTAYYARILMRRWCPASRAARAFSSEASVGLTADSLESSSEGHLSDDDLRSSYLVPWMVADVAWCYANYLVVADTGSARLPDDLRWLSIVVGVLGAMAVAMGSSWAVKEALAGRLGSSAAQSSEVLWSLANITWAMEDVLTEGRATLWRNCALGLFGLSCATVVVAFALESSERETPP